MSVPVMLDSQLVLGVIVVPDPLPPPYIDHECLELKRAYRRLARCGGDPLQVKALERRYHSLVRAKKRRWMLQRLHTVVQDLLSNPRSFWRALRGPPSPLPGPLRDPAAWDTYLDALCRPLLVTRQDVLPIEVCPILRGEPAAHLSEPFTLAEVQLCLDSLNNGKASGYSGLPAEHFSLRSTMTTPRGGPRPSPSCAVFAEYFECHVGCGEDSCAP